MTSSTRYPHNKNRRSGFALIGTLTLMILLALIMVGYLTTTAIHTRTTSADLAKAEAQANAKMALMIALGEVQRELGPDRRISAQAAILDDDPQSLDIDGIEHPRWTAVWSTDFDGMGSTPWQRDDTSGGLSDRRYDGTWDRESAVTAYLVSGNDGGQSNASNYLTAKSTLPGDPEDQVLLVGEGSIGNDPTVLRDGTVRVPKVLKYDGNDITGAYGYWVGDLGVKANIQLVDRHSDENPRPGGSATGMQRMLNAQDVEVAVLDGVDEVSDEDTAKLLSGASLAMTGAASKADVQKLYHDITTGTRTVLANVRDGDLMRDFTVYLEDENTDLTAGGRLLREGIKDDDRLAGPVNEQVGGDLYNDGNPITNSDKERLMSFDQTAPRFYLLKDWYNKAQDLNYSADGTASIAPQELTDTTAIELDRTNVYDNANQKPVAFYTHTTEGSVVHVETNLMPVLVEGSMFYNMATYPEITRLPNGTRERQWYLRVCLYPRFVLWNPYNVDMELPRLNAQIFINGNRHIRLNTSETSKFVLSIGRGARNRLSGGGDDDDKYPDHYRGNMMFTIPATTLRAGETLVFTPEQEGGRYNLLDYAQNMLTAEAAPDVSRYFSFDLLDMMRRKPTTFFESPENRNDSGADNLLMGLKIAPSGGAISGFEFDEAQQVCYINTSIQAGGTDEVPVSWDSENPVPVYELGGHGDKLSSITGGVPDVRTREGFRLRWWNENTGNMNISNSLRSFPEHMQSAVIATWNPRAAYFCRTPFENVSDIPPYFYGIYTRDNFSDEVSWDAMMPRESNGRMLGFPFGNPVDGPDAIPLFEVPRRETGVPSLAYLRHAKISEFGWHPSYAIGNSLVDPRVGRENTCPDYRSLGLSENRGWEGGAYGRNDERTDYWAQLHREILFNKVENNTVVYDLSYETNFNLWDQFFVSSGTSADKDRFFESPSQNPLKNGRLGLFTKNASTRDDLRDFHMAAAHLSLDGGFNVHSISKEAWKAILTSTRDTGYGSNGRTPFPRMLNAPGSEWNGESLGRTMWDGFRSLSDAEIDVLAEQLVAEVKIRAPFFGLADFVNRRLVNDEVNGTGDMGPLQAAIEKAGINEAFTSEFPIERERSLPDFGFSEANGLSLTGVSDLTRLDHQLKPNTTAWGIAGHLTQADVLQVVGSSLAARSDSFVIRAYGESATQGRVNARAWCEAVVQRFPDPISADEADLNPADDFIGQTFGRRFRIVSFRWLNADEV